MESPPDREVADPPTSSAIANAENHHLIDLSPVLANQPDGSDHIVEIFEAVLSPTAGETPETAARKLDKLCPPASDPDNVEGYVWQLWTLVVGIAEQVPHDSSAMETLVAVFANLRLCARGTVRLWGVRLSPQYLPVSTDANIRTVG